MKDSTNTVVLVEEERKIEGHGKKIADLVKETNDDVDKARNQRNTWPTNSNRITSNGMG